MKNTKKRKKGQKETVKRVCVFFPNTPDLKKKISMH